MNRTNRPLRLRIIGLLLALAFALQGCGLLGGGNAPAPTTPTPVAQNPAPTEESIEPSPTAAADLEADPTNAPSAPAELTEESVKEGIQAALDLYAEAYSKNKPELLKEAADQTNAPFRRYIQTRFEQSLQAGYVGTGGYSFTVASVEERDLGFWQAQVINVNGYANDWTFRQLEDGRWVMSEPTSKQVGEKEVIETEHFTFVTYEWSEDVNPMLMELMDQARQNVLDRLGKVPDMKPEVTIKPTFGVGKAENPGTLAYYDRSSRRTDKIVIFAPESYVFQSYDPKVGWQAELETTLTHEYTHLVNNRSFTPIARMSDWMIEGIAVYASQDTGYDYLVSRAVAEDKILPIIDQSDRVYKEDLEHFTILDEQWEVVTGYGLSNALVRYIVEEHGGLEGFWKLVDSYDKSQRLPNALQETFGVDYDTFQADFNTWLKANY